jgi:hypothetical protein
MTSEILKPVTVLALWTMVMWLWLYATRLPAMKRAKIDAINMVGSTGKGLRDDLVAGGEVKASWVADNYNHLHEAPTVFYAIALALAIMGSGDGLSATIAWAYVALRILHSLVQVLSNRVVVRFAIFMLSSLCLIALCLNAAMAAFSG